MAKKQKRLTKSEEDVSRPKLPAAALACFVGAALLIISVGVYFLWQYKSGRAGPVPQPGRVSQPGQAATLSPDLFTGKTAQAYQVAREIPQVLSKIFCYCGCDMSAGHKSNLDCFKDEHAAG